MYPLQAFYSYCGELQPAAATEGPYWPKGEFTGQTNICMDERPIGFKRTELKISSLYFEFKIQTFYLGRYFLSMCIEIVTICSQRAYRLCIPLSYHGMAFHLDSQSDEWSEHVQNPCEDKNLNMREFW